ncbi:Rho termination factor N-terminal domain-containing protein [Oscillatoria sp. CS-180]|uniref:Rho termination factor N-terminal domain-containing protein n=1 Tax=Oscillatoria sp. CS-180 TaxID=3021720 RepID=UPI00233001E9|nr:Rho termination factor N-terminal domain-containing protein [Oscillatoria sp. CS-180]MDB9527045.1 Rho termination factor N-terminal domain-containing protein [Oscillatoria sp. CS-180]
MSLSDTGNLMCLPFEEIEPGIPTEVHAYLIQETAKYLEEQSRNWVPLIVKEVGLDQYQVIGNSFIYAVASEAGLEEVWCIIADSTPETESLTQALCREIIPKVNLSTANRDEISSALDFLMLLPNSPLKGVNHASAVARIDEAPRQYWKSLTPITKLGCRITVGKKLKFLEQVFYLTPQPIPKVITDRRLLDSFSTKELKVLAKKREIRGYSKKKKAELIELLANFNEEKSSDKQVA